MKKIIYLFLLTSLFGLAQIPAGYYSTATGTGFALKTQLYNIINPHTTLSYTPGLWNLYYTSDIRSDGKVWDIYSNCNFIFGTAAATGGNQDDGTGGTAECQKYNREHTFPKSWFNNTSSPMYTDAFHVMPTDKKVNSSRGSLAYGKVGTATYTSVNGSKIGNCVTTGYTAGLQVFEPIDMYKGDVARNYFYMATCYQNLIGSWQNTTSNSASVLDGSNDKVYQQWYLDLMYDWHLADPVSAKETARNNAVYAVQGNRNPFIDDPSYVFRIWGPVLSANTFETNNDVNIYPNPTNNNQITIYSSNNINKMVLHNISGQEIQNIENPIFQNSIYSLENLPQGFYFLKLSADNGSLTKKIMVN